MKKFTIDEANRTLPLVRSIARTAAAASREVAAVCQDREEEARRRAQMGALGRKARGRRFEDELARLHGELQAHATELASLGAELVDNAEGLVHFPTSVENQEAVFCWNPSESEIEFFHGADEPCSHRQPIGAAASGSTGGNGGSS